MERRQLIYGFLSLLTVNQLAGCGGSPTPLGLNEILAAQMDLTKMSPDDIDLNQTDLNEIYVTEAPLEYS